MPSTIEHQRQSKRIQELLNRIARDTEELKFLLTSESEVIDLSSGEDLRTPKAAKKTTRKASTATKQQSGKKSLKVNRLEQELYRVRAEEWAREHYGL